jgi:bifunctional non-homologous end joining protein LigD
VLVDWVPNSPRALTVAPYSLRAADLPSVSAPVAWEEVEAVASGDVEERLRFGPRDALQRVRDGDDLFRPVLETAQRLPE